MTTTTCNAIKKDGKKCCFKSKPGSCFCGVHKNYIDTSKPLFSEDIKDEIKKEQMTIKFMDGSNIMVDKGTPVNKIITHIKTVRGKGNTEKYQLFRKDEEDALTLIEMTNDDELFCLFEEVEDSEFKAGQRLFIYSSMIDGDEVKPTIYSSKHPCYLNPTEPEFKYYACREFQIVKRTKCFVTVCANPWFKQMNGGNGWVTGTHSSEDRVKIYETHADGETFHLNWQERTFKATDMFDGVL
jgi:hypothetical protein